MFNKYFSVKILLALLIVTVLFTRCDDRKKYVIYYKDMQNFSQLRLENDSTVLVFSGNFTATTDTLYLPKGKYSLRFRAKGTIAAGGLPNLAIEFGKYRFKNFSIKEGLDDYKVNFELFEDTSATIALSFTNDFSSATEDRNIFFYFPLIVSPY